MINQNSFRLLVVASGNKSQVAPFISDQIMALKRPGVQISLYTVKGKGLHGYLKNVKFLKQRIYCYRPHLIHAHYGLSGLLSTMQDFAPVITSYHGSDVNERIPYIFSLMAFMRSDCSIFVSERLRKKITKKEFPVIPCGVDLDLFKEINQSDAKRRMKLEKTKKNILFSSNFTDKNKNSKLAKKGLYKLSQKAQLIELKNYTRKEVSLLMNACDVALLTSKKEGSPQFIKEAMACNTPIVSTDVGDIKWLIGNTKGCYIARFDPEDIARKLSLALKCGKISNGHKRIKKLGLDSNSISKRLFKVYYNVIESQKNRLQI